MKLAIVTATLSQARAQPQLESWIARSGDKPGIYLVDQDPGYYVPGPPVWAKLPDCPVWICSASEILGVVPAFAIGVQKALEDGAEIIACLHDDLLIEHDGWDQGVVGLFDRYPEVGLMGFGGATGLGDDDLYQTPYQPMQLARKGFVSNMRDAEAHGERAQGIRQVVCLDGFSQIGRADFWRGHEARHGHVADCTCENLFAEMQSWGVIHHFYDGMLGCFARRLGWEVLMVPVACHHYGGRTAVGDARYQEWAQRQFGQEGETFSGDQAFWHQAHKIGYDQFKDVLPLRLR